MKFKIRTTTVCLLFTWLLLPGLSSALTFPAAGTIRSVMSDSAYTYLEVELESGSCWVATVAGPYRPGGQVTLQEGVVMETYASDELGRSFDNIVFSDSVALGGGHRTAGMSGSELPPGHPPVAGSRTPPEHQEACPVSHGDTKPAEGVAGTVTEVMDAAGYTYVQVDTGEGSVWAATGKFDVKPGQSVVIPKGMTMKNFESQTLGKTFDEIYFVEGIHVTGESPSKAGDKDAAGGACCPSHGEKTGHAAPVSFDVPEGGLSVRDLFERRAELAGTDVTVRGRVAKVTTGIMGKNWIHVDDGTLEGGDLTATTGESMKKGDVVTLTGRVAVDVDMGPHYKYPLILEDARRID